METCKHCGKECQELQGILVSQSGGLNGWYAKCCAKCKAFYKRQNNRERQRQQRQYSRNRR